MHIKHTQHSNFLLLSALDKTSRVAFSSLKESFPTWKAVLNAQADAVENSIRCGGLAEVKTSNINKILQTLVEEGKIDLNGEPSLEYLRQLPTEDAKKAMLRFKGVGPKTVSCVLMFNMHRGEFPGLLIAFPPYLSLLFF